MAFFEAAKDEPNSVGSLSPRCTVFPYEGGDTYMYCYFPERSVFPLGVVKRTYAIYSPQYSAFPVGDGATVCTNTVNTETR